MTRLAETVNVVLLALLCGMLPVSANTQIKPVSELQIQLDTYLAIKHAGNIGSLLEGFDAAPAWLEWSIAREQAQLALTLGNLASFKDRLLQLETMGLPPDPGSAIRMAQLYSLAVELEVPSIDAERFSETLVAVRDGVKRLKSAHGPPPSFDDSKRRRLRANYLYLTANTAGLRELYQVESPSVGGREDELVKAYTSLLIAKLERTIEAALFAIDHLKPLLDGTEDRFDQEIGILSLYMGTAYMIMISDAIGDEKRAHLDQAVEFARRARNNLDLIDVPVMWGLATSLISDVIAVERDLAKGGSEAARILQLRSDRAHDLSIQYH